jgi:RNA-directed DNA polymerase
MLALLDAWIRASAIVSDRTAAQGVSLGAVISPFLCNVYLHRLDLVLEGENLPCVRYADDFLVLCPSRAEATCALQATQQTLQGLRLELNERKTRITTFKRGFTFLGVRFHHASYTYLPAGGQASARPAPLDALRALFRLVDRSGGAVP